MSSADWNLNQISRAAIGEEFGIVIGSVLESKCVLQDNPSIVGKELTDQVDAVGGIALR